MQPGCVTVVQLCQTLSLLQLGPLGTSTVESDFSVILSRDHGRQTTRYWEIMDALELDTGRASFAGNCRTLRSSEYSRESSESREWKSCAEPCDAEGEQSVTISIFV